MSDDFLSRWSRLKRASAQAPPADAVQSAEARPKGPPPAPVVTGIAPAPVEPQPLPPVESLSFESDFTAFMKPEVGAALKRQALKTLFQDPRFNVMDGLDVYIADYSVADPLPEGWLEKMTQVARLGEYKAPEEEAENPESEAAEVLEKASQNDALAPRPEPAPSDTLEAPEVPPPVSESPSRE